MSAEIKLTNGQRFVLSRIAQAVAQDEEAQPHWAPILLAAADDSAATGIDERTGASSVLVDNVLEKWKEAHDALTEAESGGVGALQSAIEDIFEDYEDFDTECFCCDCAEKEDSELTSYEIEMLAGKVYNLLRMELIVERERLGYAYFERY